MCFAAPELPELPELPATPRLQAAQPKQPFDRRNRRGLAATALSRPGSRLGSNASAASTLLGVTY